MPEFAGGNPGELFDRGFAGRVRGLAGTGSAGTDGRDGDDPSAVAESAGTVLDGQERRSAAVAEAVLRLADPVHIDTYELFGLRDGLTAGPRMNRFGILRDDYTPKLAFRTVQDLINRYGH